MCDSIIFDMDGTLVNFLKPMLASWNLTCQKYGWDKVIEYEELKSCMGLNGHDIGVRLFPGIDEDEATKRVEICSAEEVEYFDKVEIGPTYIPNEQFLIELSKKHKLFIVSNCQAGYIEAFLSYYGFGHYFEDIECYGNNQLKKGDNIRNVVERNHLEQAVYVGDIQGDYDASCEAGVAFIHAAYGFGTIEQEVAKIMSLQELPECVERVFND